MTLEAGKVTADLREGNASKLLGLRTSPAGCIPRECLYLYVLKPRLGFWPTNEHIIFKLTAGARTMSLCCRGSSLVLSRGHMYDKILSRLSVAAPVLKECYFTRGYNDAVTCRVPPMTVGVS